MSKKTGTESNTDQLSTTVSGRLHKFVRWCVDLIYPLIIFAVIIWAIIGAAIGMSFLWPVGLEIETGESGMIIRMMIGLIHLSLVYSLGRLWDLWRYLRKKLED